MIGSMGFIPYSKIIGMREGRDRWRFDVDFYIMSDDF